MYSCVYSSAFYGTICSIVSVETDVGMGLPSFEMTGYLGTEVREAKDRVRTAIKNSGFDINPQRIVVNISPADFKKDGTGFDLPIALGILFANGILHMREDIRIMVLGELSLDGKVNPVSGVLPCVCEAKERGFTFCMVPADNYKEALIVKDIEIIPVSDIREAAAFFDSGKIHCALFESEAVVCNASYKDKREDFIDIKGQRAAKEATLIAVAGMHNLMYVGPPGSGKTMLSRRISTIMPDMTFDEELEVTKIYSIAGQLEAGKGLITKRPFRNPFKNITMAAMMGGGAVPKPGEITLASKGVLFLDEMTEFKLDLLESLRQPLEDKEITIARKGVLYRFPADFMLVGAMNPCKCGYYPDRNRCRCSDNEIKRYIGKISKPLWDRIDICVKTEQLSFFDVCDNEGEKESVASYNEDIYSSHSMKKRIERARRIQIERFKDLPINYNSEMSSKDLKRFCTIDEDSRKLLEKVYERMNLTTRGYSKILKVARTIADLEESGMIKSNHIKKALLYKGLE